MVILWIFNYWINLNLFLLFPTKMLAAHNIEPSVTLPDISHDPDFLSQSSAAVCRISNGILILDVTNACRQFRNRTVFDHVMLQNAEPSCNKAHVTKSGIYLAIPKDRYKPCGFVPSTIQKDVMYPSQSNTVPQRNNLFCTESTIRIICSPENPELEKTFNELATFEKSDLLIKNVNAVRKREISMTDAAPKTVPDFLEVPLNKSKRGKAVIVTEPHIVMTVTSDERELMYGDMVDIGSLMTIRFRLDANASGLFGLQLQSLDATGGDGTPYVESLIHNGCATETFVSPALSQISRAVIEVGFRTFRFQTVTTVKLIATVRACIQRCQRIRCGKNSHRQSREVFLPASNSTKPTTEANSLPQDPSIHVIRKNAEYELVVMTAVEIRGYDKKYVAGMQHAAISRRSAAMHQPVPAMHSMVTIIVTLAVSLLWTVWAQMPYRQCAFFL